jgi:CheY-like chemotaxis protein
VRVQVVEDYASLRESLTRGLRDSGYAVDATGDGAEGLWHAEQGGYDAIVLDLMLPDRDGLELGSDAKKRHYEVALGSAGEVAAALDAALALELPSSCALAGALGDASRLGALLRGLVHSVRRHKIASRRSQSESAFAIDSAST